MNPNLSPIFTTHKKDHVYDRLTNLINREYFYRYIQTLIDEHTLFSLFFLDIDNFKKVNSTNGMKKGDHVLLDLAQLLKEFVNNRGVIARIEDDLFGIVVPNIAMYDDVWNFARNYNQLIRNNPFSYLADNGLRYPITVTTGIARYPIDGKSLDDLIEVTNKALYRGKTKGKNCFIIYNKEMHSNINIHDHNSQMNVTGLIHYAFLSFESSNTLDALHKISHMFGLYYSNHSIFLLTSKKAIFTFLNSDSTDDTTDKEFDLSYKFPFEFEANEPYRILYSSLIKDDKTYSEIYKTMKSLNVLSTVVYQTVDTEGKPAYLFVNSELEKVWGERELGMYLLLANLFSIYNKNKLKAQIKS